MHPPDKEYAATHGANQRTADSNTKQVEYYQIYIPAQGKSGRKPDRRARIIPVVVLGAKPVRRDNGDAS